nr:MAG TPA: hypothetical protein [Bacteriophage sp.]
MSVILFFCPSSLLIPPIVPPFPPFFPSSFRLKVNAFICNFA